MGIRIQSLTIVYFLLNTITATSQGNITSEDFEPYTTYFSLTDEYNIEGETQEYFLEVIGDNQFVGLAEVHQSEQLSFFTIGFLELLKQKDFDHLALELGPFSANILQGLSADPQNTTAAIKALNNTYGRSSFPKIPLVFVDKVEDAMFIEKASALGYKFWGLDQEFAYSYEMHLDTLFSWVDNSNEELSEYYKKSKEIIAKNIFADKINGETKNCWLLNEPTINQFFRLCQGNSKAEGLISALKSSWDIYCRNESNKPSNQLRADYMKNNFDSLYRVAESGIDSIPKVFVKLGGVHLTHGISVFGVDDVGAHLSMKGRKNQTGFLTIRHLSKYRNGKNVTGKKGWKGLETLMTLGKKNYWTVVDLRPIRQRLEEGGIEAESKISFEVYNYDLLLIPPDDRKAKLNY